MIRHFAVLSVLAALTTVANLAVHGAAAVTQAPGFDAIAVDMDPTGNTATSLGPRQECREALPGATLEIDVTVENISPSTPLLAYEYAFEFPGPTVTITDRELVMITSKAASQIFDASDPVPQFGGAMRISVLDIGDADAYESGSGVLDRLTIEVSTDASPGVYAFRIPEAVLLDHESDPHSPRVTRNGRLAIGVSCAGSTPLPEITASPTPSATGATAPPGGTIAPTGDGPTPTIDGSPSGGTATPNAGSASPDQTPDPSQEPSPSGLPDGDDDGSSSTEWIAVAVVALIVVAVAGAWLAYRWYGQRST